jgi:hypothetical protein
VSRHRLLINQGGDVKLILSAAMALAFSAVSARAQSTGDE